MLFPELSRGCELARSTSGEGSAALAESAVQLVRGVCGSAEGTQLGRWQEVTPPPTVAAARGSGMLGELRLP